MRYRLSLAGLLVCLAMLATGCASAYRSGQAALRGRKLEAASPLGSDPDDVPRP